MAVPFKLPKEVLNLFPSWEYRCPSCGTYVESNISFCPTCKTPFHEKLWRVPPRFLESHDAMSEYAHKVLAPKLTSEQRELLFQYFTELFNDGFDPHGDFSAWTGTATNGTGSTISVVSADPHHGTYHGDAHTEAGAGNARVFVTFSGQTICYARAYVKVLTNLPSTSGDYYHPMGLFASGNPMEYAAVYNDNGTVKWVLRYRNGSTFVSEISSETVSLDTWYCIELKFVVDGSVGEARLYLDGTEIVSATGLDTNNYGNVDQLGMGEWYSNRDTVHDIYFDCVIVADTYVGPESSEQTYTKTWATDALFKKLGITPEFSVDATLQKQDISATFGVGSAFQKRFSIQKQVSALFKSFGIQKNFGLDAYFGGVVTRLLSRQVDVVLKKFNMSTDFGLDVYFGTLESGAYEKTFGLTAMFAYKVMLPELWLDENGKLVFNISKPYAWVGT